MALLLTTKSRKQNNFYQGFRISDPSNVTYPTEGEKKIKGDFKRWKYYHIMYIVKTAFFKFKLSIDIYSSLLITSGIRLIQIVIQKSANSSL